MRACGTTRQTGGRAKRGRLAWGAEKVFDFGAGFARVRGVSEIVQFVNHGASLITPAVVEKLLRRLPMWKAGFTQIRAAQYPHLVDQLQFLADAVEDAADGSYKDLPYCALSCAVFALIYAHKKMDLIPDHRGELGRADDSSVVRAVLLQHEKALARYAASRGIEWSQITVKP